MSDATTPGIRPAREDDLAAMESLLSRLSLPVAGVAEHRDRFLVLEEGGRIEGTVGLEVYGPRALLRSLGVSSDLRGRGYGKRLCRAALGLAAELKVREVVLLTETAAPFFRSHGFEEISRDQVDASVRSSVEFRSCCPASATCMRLILSNPAAPASAGPGDPEWA